MQQIHYAQNNNVVPVISFWCHFNVKRINLIAFCLKEMFYFVASTIFFKLIFSIWRRKFASWYIANYLELIGDLRSCTELLQICEQGFEPRIQEPIHDWIADMINKIQTEEEQIDDPFTFVQLTQEVWRLCDERKQR